MNLKLSRSKLFFSWCEIYFNRGTLFTESGVVYYIQSKSKPERLLFPCEFKTRIIDLLQDEAVIFKAFKSNTRNEIRKIEKENYECSVVFSPSKNDILVFLKFYNSFCEKKGLNPGNFNKLLLLKEKDALVISNIICCDEVVAYHVYIKSSNRVRLLYSATNYNLLNAELIPKIGKFNRLLHWFDIQKFKNSSIAIYDLGGIGIDSIAAFKSSFGGVPILEYNFFYGNTIISRFISFCMNLYRFYLKS